MPLTPDDVLNKQFQHVRFKEGFDPDEVDDFLDEVVAEWRRLIEENEQLKARVAELEAQGPAAPAAETAAPEPVVAPAPAPAVAEQPAEEPAAAAVSSTASSAASIIERAQRLHDEHVAEGEAKADRIVSEAQSRADQILNDAERNHREVTAKLDTDRRGLEGRITELRHFERDYRDQLRQYFEGKLKDLDSGPSQSTSSIGL